MGICVKNYSFLPNKIWNGRTDGNITTEIIPMVNGKAKGNNFEREICKKLSLWITKGSDDSIFWRSTNSGGRATSRSKIGKKTANSYGDIAALVPLGEEFLRVVNAELKTGYNSLSLS